MGRVTGFDHQYRVIGTRPVRLDGVDKVTGRAVYAADFKLPNMLWGAVLRSPHAHAAILDINTSEAEAMPGVMAAITHADLPPAKRVLIDMAGALVDAMRARSNILAREKALYVGHAVAAVAAIDRNLAVEAIKRIKVRYERLPAVMDVDEAAAEGAPILLEDYVADHLGEEVTDSNIAWHFRNEFGDPESGFRDSVHVVEREFTFQTIHQGYIESQVATALWDQDGRIRIWSSTQGGFGVREQTAGILGLEASCIEVLPLEIGGGFGGKTVVFLEPVAALLSKKAGRPVRLVMDRRAVFEGTSPSPGGKVSVKMGVDDSGRIRAAEASIRFEAGAYPGWVADTGAKSVFSCYNIPNVRIDGYDILVNKPKSDAYRAPGAPQVTLATESVVDEICDSMGWDAFEFRLKNASREGTRRSDGPKFERVGLEETLRAARASDHWRSPIARKTPDGKVRGRGIASAFCLHAGREATITLQLNRDGNISLTGGSVDLSGTRTTIAMQAAEVLGIPIDRIQSNVAGTGGIGFTEISHGSRTTFASGLAAYKASKRLIEIMKEHVAKRWETDPEHVAFERGVFSSLDGRELSITFHDLAGWLCRDAKPVTITASVNPADPGGGVFGTHIADVEVDPTTGKIDVIRYTVVQDVGKAIHPGMVEGQMQGGAAQGIGWALTEGYFMSADGAMLNHTLLDYRMPTAVDLPNIETIIVEVQNPRHPFGVRGAGENAIAPPLAAISNAIHDALGIRLREMPMTPSRVLQALADKAS